MSFSPWSRLRMNQFQPRQPQAPQEVMQQDPTGGLSSAFQGMPGAPEMQGGGRSGVSNTAGMSIIGKTGQGFEDKLHSFEEQLPMNPWSMMPEGWGDQIKSWTRQAKTPMKMLRQNGGGKN